jgi:hypothetical protein
VKPILSLAVAAMAAALCVTNVSAQKMTARTGTPIRSKVAVSPFAPPPESKPAGVWQSETQVLPTAGCHPHCHTENDGSGFGDPYSFSFSPRETPPDGYTYRYANPHFVSMWGGGCPFEVWNPFQTNAGGATLTAWARSVPCYFTVALDRFAVPLK